MYPETWLMIAILVVSSQTAFGLGIEKTISVPNSPADVADTSIQAELADAINGAAALLPAGQGKGYAEDAHILIRFDNLPRLEALNIRRIRVGLFREWIGDSYWDDDDFLLLVLPAPRPFNEKKETWNTAARAIEPNNAMGESSAKETGALRSGLHVTRNPKGMGEYKWADITNIAQGWFAGTRANDGLVTVTDYYRSQPGEGSAYFTSSEGPQNQRPLLEITYVVRPDGVETPRHAIVHPTDAPVPERTAAQELALHLREATGEWYELVEENKFEGKRPAIYVGWTKYARANGYRPGDLPESAFEIGIAGDNIVLCGSRPRGSLYAVVEYLENACGFRWFTFHGEVNVPKLKRLPLPKEPRVYTPAFAARDLMTPYPFVGDSWSRDPSLNSVPDVQASDRWMAMNRINGNTTAAHHPLLSIPSEKYGGFYEPYVAGVAHTCDRYISPNMHFRNHPEWFAMNSDGSRTTRGLCLTNQGLRQQFLGVLRADIRSSGARGIYSISPPDGGAVCQCAQCKAMAGKHGSCAAAYVDFVDYLGKNIATEFPGVTLEILAYGSWRAPPKDMVCEPNVLVRYAPIYKLHWDRLDAPGNDSQVMKNLKGWLKIDPRRLRIWEYPHRYGSDSPIYPTFRADRRESGVLQWVKKAVADPNVAQSGLCITMADDTGAKHYVSLDGGMNIMPSFPITPKPTLIVSYRKNGRLTRIELPASSVACVSSDSPNVVPPVQMQGILTAAQVAGNPNSQGLKSFVYLRFDLSKLSGAKIVDASFQLFKNGEEEVKEDGTFVVYAVRDGAVWDSAVTWNTRPDVEANPVFTLPAYKGKRGFEGYDALFPQPNIFVLLENLRIYRDMGAKGMFMETDAGLLDQQCMADIVYWVLAKGMWDTSRSPEDLVHDFCTSYYGKAGADVFRYLKLLDRAYAQDPVKIPVHLGNWARQAFFTYGFAEEAHSIFDRAASKVAGSPEITERVLRARAPQDIATLFYLNRFKVEYRRLHNSLEGFASDRATLEDRYTASRMKMIDRFYPGISKDTEMETIRKMFHAAEQMPEIW